MRRAFYFPGVIDVLIVMLLIALAPKWIDGFLVFPVVAMIRIALPVLFMKINASRRGLSYDLILVVLGAAYLFFWGKGDTPSMIMAYMGCAAAAEIIIVLFVNRRRLSK